MSKVVSEAAWQEPQGTSYFIFSLGMDFSSFTPDLAFFSLRQNFGKRRKTTSKSVFFSIVLDRTPAAFSASIVGRSCARDSGKVNGSGFLILVLPARTA